jgi:hypothetical protein
MDLYTATQLLGKDPANRNARNNTINLLRRNGITPIRRGWYDDEQVRAFASRYHAYMEKYPKQRHITSAPTNS